MPCRCTTVLDGRNGCVTGSCGLLTMREPGSSRGGSALVNVTAVGRSFLAMIVGPGNTPLYAQTGVVIPGMICAVVRCSVMESAPPARGGGIGSLAENGGATGLPSKHGSTWSRNASSSLEPAAA